MRSKTEINLAIDVSTEGLVRAFREFPSELFHLNPAPGSWSAAEIAGHIYITERLTNRSLLGRTEPGGEDPEAKIEPIQASLLNFETKLKAPDILNAKLVSYPQEEILPMLKEVREALKKIILTEDISARCEFSHPHFGKLTRVEWAFFYIYHTERHLHQLQRVREALS